MDQIHTEMESCSIHNFVVLMLSRVVTVIVNLGTGLKFGSGLNKDGNPFSEAYRLKSDYVPYKEYAFNKWLVPAVAVAKQKKQPR